MVLDYRFDLGDFDEVVMSRIVVFGPPGERKAKLIERFSKLKPGYPVITDWDGLDALPDDCLVDTTIYPTSDMRADCLVVELGKPICVGCE